VTDQVLGICRVDPLPLGTPPWQATNCNATAKSGGQAVVANVGPAYSGSPLPTGAKFVFVPDASSKSQQVVRFVFNPATETLSGALVINVPNQTAAHGGGASGGRPSAAALAPNGVDLFVGYTKSGDVMKVAGATNNTSSSPAVTWIGETSDGLGVNAMVQHKGDLYLAETGGLGLSRIQDPAGLTRAACSPSAVCAAITVNPAVSFFPGGLASDGTYIYVGDAPLTTAGRILRYDPAARTIATVSSSVPAYVSTFDGQLRTGYYNPWGLALAPNGDLYVSDDPTASLAIPAPPSLQGHLYRVPASPLPPTVTSLDPATGATGGGYAVSINGTGFATGTLRTQVMFGLAAATGVSCDTTSHCTAIAPASAGPGVVDVRVYVDGLGSPIAPADQFNYVAASAPGAPVISKVSPSNGQIAGGTPVTITGSNLLGGFVTFGVNAAVNVTCASDTACTAISPAGAGTVDVHVTSGSTGLTSAASQTDRFTYTAPTAGVWAWGITAPKGGMLWVPGALGGHWWSSDHASGFCRQDPVAGTKLYAINWSVCDNGAIGSPGQAVYEPRPNADGTHYIYVPDNAVKSTAIWRLTFNPSTETVTGAPEAMIPLANVTTLKPNGMAIGPDGNLYVSDLTEMNIRRVTSPAGDPRLQTVQIVAVTGDGRGANGTMGFLGNRLYISENRAASWIDITQCPLATGLPCGTTPLPIPAGAFIAGVATDPANGFVYASDSPGGSNAAIWRYSTATGATTLFLNGGTLPAAGTPESTVFVSQTAVRPWDPSLTPGGPGAFAFAFGINVGPDGSLFITEDPTAGARAERGKVWVAPFIP
jgi:sugar lactone lactonase YvrE